MKTPNYILVLLVVMMLNISCNNAEKITYQRGKVKIESISLAGKVPGRIEKIWTEEGKMVKKGDTLLSIYSPEVQAKLTQAEGAVFAARAQLKMAYNGATLEQVQQINGKLEAAEAQLDYVKESFNRTQNMFKDSLIPLQKYDEVKMKLQMAKSGVEAIRAKQNEVKKGTRTEKIAQAKGQLQRALGALEEVKTALTEKYIIAPQDMKIQSITLLEGELVTPGYALITGYLPQKQYFRFTIPETLIYNYKLNQKITLLNPFTKKEIEAKIIAIKQLPHYADITSTSESYGLTESVYELKLIPLQQQDNDEFYQNATVLIK